MLEYHAAIAAVLTETRRLGSEPVPLARALGRVLAAPLHSPADLPAFDNSAMDGFALAVGGDALRAGEEFAVSGETAAGDAPARLVAGACEIMTGAPLPAGADAVIPVEQVELLATTAGGRPSRIRLRADVAPGQHVRRAGEDITRGAPLLPDGAMLDAAALMLLAALGIDPLPVRRSPRVALLCTGRELVDDPAQPLAPGQIRNSNGPFLAARLATAGATLVQRATVADDVDAFIGAFEAARATGCDMVLSTGAVSMGRYDFVPQALARLGARVVFHKVAIRPGKPLLFAVLPDGVLYFGLPGNPVSSAVGLRFFVEPALRAMLGMPAETPLRLPLAAAIDKKPGLRFLQKAALQLDVAGVLQVRVLRGQESFRIEPLLHADAWAVLPESAERIEAGTWVEVWSRGHLQPLFRGAGA